MIEPLPGYRTLGDPPLPGSVVFVVSADYHVRDAVRTRTMLRELGIDAAIVTRCPPSDWLSRYRPTTLRLAQSVQAAREAGLEMSSTVDGEWLAAHASCVVVRNDWGPDHGLVVRAKAHRIPTIGWVEGVQDFTDADTGRDRRPYCSVDRVFALGQYDESQLRSIGVTDTVRIGTDWAWNLWRTDFPDADRRAVINVNFTYGVHTAARRGWVGGALSACKRASLPAVVSRHPADRGIRGRRRQTATPIVPLLADSSHLISRFSTVMYYGLLVGTPTFYFNPHGEKAATFKDAGRALSYSEDHNVLARQLEQTTPSRAQQREIATEFLRYHLELDSPSPPARAAQAIADAVRVS